MGYGYSHRVEHNATARDLATGERVGQSFSSDMAAHVWAQRRQTFGRSGTGIVYFHGRALFDYGAHYCAAYIVADDSAVLYNASYVSPTTSGHVSAARYAARPRQAVGVPDLTGLLAGRTGESLYPGRASYGEVTGTAEFESAIDARLGDRAWIRSYCEAHALELAPESLAFLLGRVGLARSAGRIVADAERKRDKAKAERKREEKRRAIETLKAFAAAPDLAAYAADARPWHYADAAAIVAHVAPVIRKARKAAGKASVSPAIWRKAWARLQSLGEPDTIDSIRRELERREARANRKSRLQGLANALTQYRHPVSSYQPDADAHAFEHARAAVQAVENKATRAGRLAQAIGALWPVSFESVSRRLYAAGEQMDSFVDSARRNPALVELREQWEAAKAERARLEREQREREQAERLASWRAGAAVGRISAARPSGAAYIRAVGVERDESGAIVAGELETSLGASVPLVQAVRAFRFLKLVRERGDGWRKNGARIRVGHFEVDSISPTGDFVAGCHSFEWADVRELAESLGVFDLAPDDSAVRTREAA